MRIVLQKSLNDCGLACVAMLAEYCELTVDYNALLSLAPEGMWEQGLTMKKLREIADALGLETQAYRCPANKLYKLEQPCIAHCRGNHYVVVETSSANGVELIDPRYGRIALSLEEFGDTYSGVCLVAELAEVAPERPGGFRKVESGVWQREMKICFRRWVGSLLALAGLQVAMAALALAATARFFLPGPVLYLAVAGVAWGEGLLLARLFDPWLLRAYARIVSRIADLSSPAQGHLIEVPGGYRLSERMRWMAEQLYNSRENFLELARFVAGVVALLIYSIVVRDVWLGVAAAVFGAAATATESLAIRSLPLTAEEHSERRFIDALLRQFTGGPTAPLPPLRPRSLGSILDQRLALLVGGSLFVAYWLLTPRSHSTAEFLVVGIAQLKLLEWCKSAVPASVSCRIIHHCYVHLECMHVASQNRAAQPA